MNRSLNPKNWAPIRWLMLCVLATGCLWMVACGPGLDDGDANSASPVSEMVTSHDEALIPVARYASEDSEFEKPGAPERVGTPSKWEGSKYEADRDGSDDAEAAGDDPILVRETGFRPAEGDDVIEVRSTFTSFII